MTIIDDPDALSAHLAPVRDLVVLDGCKGAGKTRLMRDMAVRLGCEGLDLDPFINRRTGRVLDALDYDAIRDYVSVAMRRSPLVLFSGICARAVLERTNLVASVQVYVQRNSPISGSADYILLDAEEVGESADRPYFSELDREVLMYHARYQPKRNADVLYIRTET